MKYGRLHNCSEVFEREAVTVADLPPAYLAEVLAAWEKSGHVPKRTPRLLICGGEALTPDTVRLWRNGPLAQSRLINAYGPTEATITALTHEVTPADLDAVPIGRPLPGTSVYVLDPNGQPVPEGVPGELYIGGSRLALGYVGHEDLTRERFVPNPFGQGRLYRTGDRVAFIPGTEGRLAFLGRVDSQVKIRGFRVELGEVEAALAACGVGQAVVIFRDGCSGRLRRGRRGEVRRRSHRGRDGRAPAWLHVSGILRSPRCSAADAGRQGGPRALEDTGSASRSRRPIAVEAAPLDAAEERMIGIWRDVFGESEKDLPLGRDSDFFALGGHSLLAVRLLSAIERAYGQSLSMADLIAAPTVADQVRRSEHARHPRIFIGTRRAAPGLGRTRSSSCTPLAAASRATSRWRASSTSTGPSTAWKPRKAAATRVRSSGSAAAGRRLSGGLARTCNPKDRICSAAGRSAVSSPMRWRASLLRPAKRSRTSSSSIPMRRRFWRSLAAAAASLGPDILTVFARDLIGRVGTEPLRRDDGRDVRSIEDLYSVPELSARLAGVDQERLRSRFAVFRTNMLMAEAYRPEPCSVAAKIYVAAQGHPDRTRGWSGLAVGGLSIEDLPGDHYALLAEPAVERLADLAGARDFQIHGCASPMNVIFTKSTR